MQYSDTTGSRQSFNYYLSNHQGSIIGMMQDADGTSALTTPYTYDAYGNMRDTEDGAGQPFRYTGRRYDEETGLYYYRARYYSAKLGRFLQTDPIGYEDNMNLYAYTGNDPINNTDPTGMVKVPPSPCSFEGAKDSGASSVTCLEGWGEGGAGADGKKKKKDQPCCSLNDTGRGTATSTLNDDGSTTPGVHHTGGEIDPEVQKLILEYGITAIAANSTGSLMLRADTSAIKYSRASRISAGPLEGTTYTSKVLRQMYNGSDLYHAFPRGVDRLAVYGSKITFKGGDGVYRTRVTLRGAINGKKGTFEWIIEANKSINHRLFVPD